MGDVPNTIVYMLSSDVPEHVESVELVASVFNVAHESQAVAKFRDCCSALLSALQLDPPQSIADAIASSKPAVADIPQGRITLERDEARMGYTLTLKIEDATALGLWWAAKQASP